MKKIWREAVAPLKQEMEEELLTNASLSKEVEKWERQFLDFNLFVSYGLCTFACRLLTPLNFAFYTCDYLNL